jgi:predicted  nucleic acid-binding Zn-ribbon protein
MIWYDKFNTYIDSYEKVSHSNLASTERTVNESLRKVKDIESINNAFKSDNDRLLHRIQELENDNIRLKTDIATGDVTKGQNIQSMQLKVDDLEHVIKRLKSNIQKLQDQVGEVEQEWKDKITQIKYDRNRALVGKEERITALEEENKQANEKIFRSNKFRQSVFSLGDETGYSGHNYEPLQTSHSFPENTQMNIRPEPQSMRASQEVSRVPRFKMEKEFKTLGSSKDRPIELQPVRVSPANSRHSKRLKFNWLRIYIRVFALSYIIPLGLIPTSPTFSKASESDQNGFKSYEEGKNQPKAGPVNNPYFKGSMHVANMMLGISNPDQAQPVQRFPHEFQASQNDRNYQPPTSTDRNINQQYNF